jgi:PmbA protein
VSGKRKPEMEIEKIACTIEKLLKEHTPDGYEISFGSSRNLSIEVKDQMIDTFKCSTPVGVGIRVLKSAGMGFSYSTSMEDSALAKMVENAVVGALNQTPDLNNGFPLPLAYPEVDGMYDEGLSSVAEQEKILRAMDLERFALSADTRVKRVRKAQYGESEYRIYIRNSLGVAGTYQGTAVSCSVTAVAEQGDDSQMGWDFGYSNSFSGIDVGKIAGMASAKALALLGARKIATMRCPVILDTYVASEILEVLAPSFLAENIQKGKSMLAGRMGERLFSGSLCIRDDGTLPGGMASAPFDAEGVPHQNNVLVDRGFVKGFLYDSYSARKEGTSSTGNCVRGGVKSPPRMGISNFFIENGTVPQTEMIRTMGKGLLLTGVMGMHTANPISGDFSVGASGIMIERGEFSHPVKGIAIAGNIIDLFRDVVVVGNDLRFYGGVGSPSLAIGTLDVSGE